MKIINLQVENIKRVKAVNITPKGNVLTITGKNGQGKTSVLDAIELAIDESRAKQISEPIRKGQDKANIRIELDEFIVTRKYTSNDKSYLSVESKEGAKYNSPQKLLDGFVGKLSFDPLHFCNLKPKEQIQTLLSVVTLDVDPVAIDAKKKELFEERTIVNREVKSIDAQLAAMPLVFPSRIPDEEVSAADILAKIQKANEELISNNAKRTELSALGTQFNSLKNEKKNIEQKIADLQEELKAVDVKIIDVQSKGKALKEEVEKLVDPDTSLFTEELKNLEETNQKVREKQVYMKLEDKLLSKKQEAEKLTREIEELEEQKTTALKNAKFPIKGLGFDEAGVTYNNIPFSQCCSAEQLKISLAMAMAMNPKLKVIRIMDGSLLDSSNMEIIQKMAEAYDYQIWIEKVDESGKVGIMIEDGEVKVNNYEEPSDTLFKVDKKAAKKKVDITENAMFD